WRHRPAIAARGPIPPAGDATGAGRGRAPARGVSMVYSVRVESPRHRVVEPEGAAAWSETVLVACPPCSGHAIVRAGPRRTANPSPWLRRGARRPHEAAQGVMPGTGSTWAIACASLPALRTAPVAEPGANTRTKTPVNRGLGVSTRDRKSTRLNSSHVKI